MNDFSELEGELRQLRPAAPSSDLHARVERALQEVSSVPTAAILPRRRTHRGWFVIGFGLAAASAFFLMARMNVDHASQSKTPRVASAAPVASSLRPDGMTRVIYQSSDDGLVYPENLNEPARRLVSRSRETFQWRDASNGASLRVSYPTEEIELVPVSLSVQ